MRVDSGFDRIVDGGTLDAPPHPSGHSGYPQLQIFMEGRIMQTSIMPKLGHDYCEVAIFPEKSS